MITVFKAKEQRCSRVWWWWQKHTLHWQNVGTNIERDKLRENVHTKVDHSAIAIRRRKVDMKKLKSRHRTFHFQNPVTLWRMLTQHFRDMSLKYTLRYKCTVSKPECFYIWSKQSCEWANSNLATTSQSIRVQPVKMLPQKYAFT